jgi:hypothetical protein
MYHHDTFLFGLNRARAGNTYEQQPSYYLMDGFDHKTWYKEVGSHVNQTHKIFFQCFCFNMFLERSGDTADS